MSRNIYAKALKTAERELIALIRQQEKTERLIAQARQTVLTLRMRVHPDVRGYSEAPKTLTDAAQTAIFAARKPLMEHEVLDAIHGMGFQIKAKNQLASLYSVIKRLVEQGQIIYAYPLGKDGKGPVLWLHSLWPNVQQYPPPKGWVALDAEQYQAERARQEADGTFPDRTPGVKKKE